jgi:hypothetical protein
MDLHAVMNDAESPASGMTVGRRDNAMIGEWPMWSTRGWGEGPLFQVPPDPPAPALGWAGRMEIIRRSPATILDGTPDEGTFRPVST